MAELYRDGSSPAPEASYRVSYVGERRGELLGAGSDTWRDVPAICWGPLRYRTAFKALWTSDALYLRFDATDEAPWHTKTARDDHLWEEEVVEFFLDPVGNGLDYAEVEISPANIVCDLKVRSPWPRLVSDRRWHWDGLQSRVVRTDVERGGPDDWTATACLPWAGLSSLSEAVTHRLPPRVGDRWRFNVFRIKRPHGPLDPEREALYAAWSVPDGPSFHVPDKFRDFVFGA